ncbi:MAG: hypothetical protein ACSHXD_17735 [Marinosulfonomonas sp.]
MKPGFALILSQDGISLLLRANGGWRGLGKADPSSPTLTQDLRYLQRTATELSGGQFATKLVIPNAQILYRKIAVESASDSMRTAMIRAELDGATPYKLDELVFDWCEAEEGFVHVAVVATQTLAEAETFAVEHQFNPVSCVAAPEPGSFSQEPFFGETQFAESLLLDGETVEPDDDIIDVIAQTEINELPVIQEVATAAPIATEDEPVEIAPADQVAFSTRRDTDRPVNPDEPLALKWVAPRIAVGALNVAPAPENKDADGQELKAEITPMAVTAPDLARPARAPKPAAKAKPATIPLAPENRAQPVKTTRAAPSTASDEEKSLTIFGAREAAQRISNSGYLGLSVVMGVAAVLILVLLYVGGLLGSSTETAQFDAVQTDSTQDLGEAQTASAAVESASFTEDPQEPSDTAPVADIDIAALSVPDISTIELSVPTQQEIEQNYNGTEPAELADQNVAQAAYALSGIWQLSPSPLNDPKTDHLSDLYVASIDQPIVIQDAVALPSYSASQPDQTLNAAASPAPSGTTFDLDERGLVRPTAQGALTPDGIRVYAGKPTKVPALRPTTGAFLEPRPTPTEEIIGIRPLPRPEKLAEQMQRARFGGRTLAELGEKRPLPRPEIPEGTVITAPVELSQLVITRSIRPKQRPSGLSNQVNSALAAVAVNDAVDAAVKEASKQEPQPEPKAKKKPIVSANAASAKTPSSPSKPSVAKEATLKNAIKLSEINLIGVYGSSSDRRALVRLHSGRYVKVQVGDRLDGGRVASIGSSELKYVKSGRNVTLKMPTG